MSFRVTTNLLTNKTRCFINGRRVSLYHFRDVVGYCIRKGLHYNCSFLRDERGLRISTFCYD